MIDRTLHQISALSAKSGKRIVQFHWHGLDPERGIIRAKNEAFYHGYHTDLSEYEHYRVNAIRVLPVDRDDEPVDKDDEILRA